MGIKDDLKRAIEARNTISFDYKGHRRIAEPYHYGIPVMTAQYKMIKKPQEVSLLCYQIKHFQNKNIWPRQLSAAAHRRWIQGMP